MVQTNFKRYELKYILTVSQYKKLLDEIPQEIKADKYGRHKISNIYFDTNDYKVIRHSIEKPQYKEKLRIRCYGEPSKDSDAFIELKKKFKGIVYKRRVFSKQINVFNCLDNGAEDTEQNQILKEINYFRNSYEGIVPKIYLSYQREAFYSCKDDDFRLTFDFNIRTRNHNVSLYSSNEDVRILTNDVVLLEVKTVMGLPIWFLKFLSENKIYKTSFSKYGTAYKIHFFPQFLTNLRGELYV